MKHLNEIESYACSFASEIKTAFRHDVTLVAAGLATNHSLDGPSTDALLWNAVIEALQDGPETGCGCADVCLCTLDEEE